MARSTAQIVGHRNHWDRQIPDGVIEQFGSVEILKN
jgi:hypothetical protein